MKVRTKPEEYEAIQYTGNNLEECLEFSKPYGYMDKNEWVKELQFCIETGKKTHIMEKEDFIVKEGFFKHPMPYSREDFKEKFDIIEPGSR